jgi:integrase
LRIGTGEDPSEEKREQAESACAFLCYYIYYSITPALTVRGFFISFFTNLISITMKRVSKKGCRFTSDFVEYSAATLKGQELLWSEKQSILGFYIIFAINTGLRVSDILSRKHSELINLRSGDFLSLTEKKTKKFKQIQINSKITESYLYLSKKLQETGKFDPDGYIFTSQKGSVYCIESLNTILKKVFSGFAEHVSSHSLRKSFGRHVYDRNGQSENALTVLSEMLNHESLKTTRIYLGLRREELGNVYMNL